MTGAPPAASLPAAALTVACVQVNAGPDIEPNLTAVGDLILRAREAGADFITTPENVSMMVLGRSRVLRRARPEDDHPAVPFFRDMAKRTGAWLLAGSLAVKLDEERVANRSLLFSPEGEIAGRYDKIHMFDVDLARGESYRESATFRPGDRAVLAATPWGGVGMTVCYDLRFAYLYRMLAHAGASVLTVPSAFTVPTGRAHWHVLLRARAIETGCFVVAPAQCGTHDGGRTTYGHSLIISPWGEILADGGEEPGVVTARLDLEEVAKARAQVPSLKHDRTIEPPESVP
ncbi:carbon-nitrogen hydrolase family protein [Skermanella sp. TT6]|uniref:Carbon-nitrogen hydrolase family protein n=1 Tax=Skermanella cutis TaxID=2775420 RepID=A0ABX7B3P8_9PROT|nr:carbon-nitrogen hydrolase family protein [Skermanella sp. TT6]QQP88971.1 carbon-nitrogen hydrolase family protein [Skermanella sp. TT6]